MFALRLWLSATPETDAPSCEHCCRTWAFNCALYARRLGTSSVDSLSIVSTISFVYTMPYLANRLKMGSPPAYGHTTVHDKELAKNTVYIVTLCELSNLWMPRVS